MKLITGLLIVLFIISCSLEKSIVDNSWRQSVNMNSIAGINFEENRIFLKIPGQNKDTILFFTDTGGGKTIFPEAVEALDLQVDSIFDGYQIYEAVDLSQLFRERTLPIPEGVQFVYRNKEGIGMSFDGMLGANWFGKKIWHFDYIHQTLSVADTIYWDSFDKERIVKIGFMKDAAGNNLTHFPRIPIVVQNDTIQTLFDSGATAQLSETGRQKFNTTSDIGTSFIIASIFDNWRSQNPEWEVFENGDHNLEEDMIKVPKVTIGGYEVGPVWFARRKDQNFTEYMSKWMDQPISGAVGGSCLQYFNSIIIDYNEGLAFFEIE